jgi:hypothetical protein
MRSVLALTHAVLQRSPRGTISAPSPAGGPDDLERYLTNAYGFNVTLEYVDLGIEVVDSPRSKAGKERPLPLGDLYTEGAWRASSSPTPDT